jgi:hypothetical protein
LIDNQTCVLMLASNIVYVKSNEHAAQASGTSHTRARCKPASIEAEGPSRTKLTIYRFFKA